MPVKIQEIPFEGLHLSQDLDPKRLNLSEKGLTLLQKVHVELDLTKQGEGEVYARGSLSTMAAFECSRCLQGFSHPLCSDFHLVYVPRSGALSEGEPDLSIDALDLVFYDGDQIDFDNDLVAQLHLCVPMNPVCRPDCRGLCSQCGEDLNLRRCTCRNDSTDLHWSDLGNFSYKESNAKSKT
ncbi:MAG: DUF177 domain-containing protein [Nitrospiria bacterium]